MSTRARIGLLQDDGSVQSIYSHWDGYPSNGDGAGAGETLRDHWADSNKLRQLLALGDLSRLGIEIGQAHDFETSFREHPQWCLAYGRDRGESDIDARVHPRDEWPDYGQEWEYLYDPACGWLCRGLWQDDPSWRSLGIWIDRERERIERYLAEEARTGR
jgi:hypothetical protein